jgi:hypothetical protein
MNERAIMEQLRDTLQPIPTPKMKTWQLLSDPRKFTTGCLARDRNDEPVSPTDLNAAKWCTVGGLILCYGKVRWVAKHDLLHSELNAIACIESDPSGEPSDYAEGVSEWNDSSDYETVVAKLKELDI